MYAHFDRSSPAKLDVTVTSLSWKGAPAEGWLAVGNSAKTVGVTYTELSEEKESGAELQPEISLERQSMRRNFNFREHSQEVRQIGSTWDKWVLFVLESRFVCVCSIGIV